MTVDELLACTNAKLDGLGIRVPDGSRAGRYVDLRGFRYYRSQGLVDSPNEKRGVAGLYGERHVAQLVAIKTMQSRWMPLSEIRRQLAHASDEQLTAIAARPDAPVARLTSQHRIRTDQAARHWVELRLGDDAFAMVNPALLGSARPSALRALGERLVGQLLAERGRLAG